MTFKKGDIVLCQKFENGEPDCPAIIASDPHSNDSTLVLLSHHYWREKWHGTGAWPRTDTILHPDPDAVWASFVAAQLRGEIA